MFALARCFALYYVNAVIPRSTGSISESSSPELSSSPKMLHLDEMCPPSLRIRDSDLEEDVSLDSALFHDDDDDNESDVSSHRVLCGSPNLAAGSADATAVATDKLFYSHDTFLQFQTLSIRK